MVCSLQAIHSLQVTDHRSTPRRGGRREEGGGRKIEGEARRGGRRRREEGAGACGERLVKATPTRRNQMQCVVSHLILPCLRCRHTAGTRTVLSCI
eukprot:3509793-Rhodomonas_salina.2